MDNTTLTVLQFDEANQRWITGSNVDTGFETISEAPDEKVEAFIEVINRELSEKTLTTDYLKVLWKVWEAGTRYT
jgi:hypothetical protein